MTPPMSTPMPTAIQSFVQQLSFPLDDFQQQAIEVIAQGHSVVVCAPTGSGKTVIAEFTAHQAIETGRKLFYTTPLKALSNQKYHDLKAQYGEQNVGLLTGDLSMNREARIVVMTTEVFRNMLYGMTEDSQLLEKVGYVVLDECHYMNDAERGTVWEETIIYCPTHIQLVALSATVANAEELTEWINEVHHDTRLISSSFRPVPLRFYYAKPREMLPLFETPGRMNKKLKLSAPRRPPRDKKEQDRAFVWLIEELHHRDMLPAIFFTFSRAGCDKHLRNTMELNLLTDAERMMLREKVQAYIATRPFLNKNPMLSMIENGFASHHAGLLPDLKHLVENLFQAGLIKVVFATETLAAGINMPARSTVITSISKRTNDGHRVLTASEFLQMSGRAGRRGMDTVGHVIVMQSPFHHASEAARLASSEADALNSQFTPTYGMVLNLLQRHTLEEAQFLLEQSFGQFTAQRRLRPLSDAIHSKERELTDIQQFVCPAHLSDETFEGFLKTLGQVRIFSRQIGQLRHQLKRHGRDPALIAELNHQEDVRAQLQKQLDSLPCESCDLLKKHERLMERRHKLGKKLRTLQAEHETEKHIYWQRFLNIYQLLKTAGYIDAGDKPTPLGILTSRVRTENEFFLAELIRLELLEKLDPPVLAAALAMVVNDSTKEYLYTSHPWSSQTREIYRILRKEARRVREFQEKYQVEISVNAHPLAAGLLEAWANGASWADLLAGTNMDEGDLVRIVRRTCDLLHQLGRIPEIPSGLAHSARLAYSQVYRDPIREIETVDTQLETLPPSPPEPTV